MKRSSLYLVLVSAIAASTAQATETSPAEQGPEAQVTAEVAAQESPRVSSPTVPVVSPQERDYYQREAALAQQKRLLDLQLEIHEREQKLAGVSSRGSAPARSEPTVISRAPADSSAGAQRKPTSSAAASRSSSTGLAFTVVSIWGPDEALQAQVYSHGLRITVREGDSLPGGWVVRKVARTGLIINRGRTERTVVIGG